MPSLVEDANYIFFDYRLNGFVELSTKEGLSKAQTVLKILIIESVEGQRLTISKNGRIWLKF